VLSLRTNRRPPPPPHRHPRPERPAAPPSCLIATAPSSRNATTSPIPLASPSFPGWRRQSGWRTGPVGWWSSSPTSRGLGAATSASRRWRRWTNGSSGCSPPRAPISTASTTVPTPRRLGVPAASRRRGWRSRRRRSLASTSAARSSSATSRPTSPLPGRWGRRPCWSAPATAGRPRRRALMHAGLRRPRCGDSLGGGHGRGAFM